MPYEGKREGGGRERERKSRERKREGKNETLLDRSILLMLKEIPESNISTALNNVIFYIRAPGLLVARLIGWLFTKHHHKLYQL